MKFALAMLVHLVIGLVLVWGIILAVTGNYWLLMGGFLAYLIALIRFGCLPQ